MNYNELKNFINSLPEEKLSQTVVVFPHLSFSFEVRVAKIEPENLYYNIWDPERGLERMDKIENFDDKDYKIGIPAGTVVLLEGN